MSVPYVPTATQIADLRADVRDTGTPQAFTDAELTRLLVREFGDNDRAALIAIDRLLLDSARFNTYALGQATESKADLREGLAAARDRIERRKRARVFAFAPVEITA
jgi:hypothetical protein